MSSTVKLYNLFEVNIDGHYIADGGISSPIEITLSNDKMLVYKDEIAISTTVDVWDSSDEKLSSFTFMYLKADNEVYLELTVDRGNDVGTEIVAIQIEPNVPFILGGDTAFANYTADFAGGTADVIDRIRIRNNSSTASDTANVFLFLGD